MKTLALFAALILSTAANALEGRATTTDGDTVVVNGISVRLKGVDAAEVRHRARRGGDARDASYCRQLAAM